MAKKGFRKVSLYCHYTYKWFDFLLLKYCWFNIWLQEVYGLYKQATLGDCNIEKPGMTELRAQVNLINWVT